MLSRPLLLRGALALLAGVVALGLWHLFALRFAGGDVYPPYSTLRADPLGAKALYDALAETPGLSVTRNYLPLVKLHPNEPVTLLYAGIARQSTFEPAEQPALEALLRAGSRAVFVFRREPLDAGGEAKRVAEEEKAKKERAERARAPASPAASPAPHRSGREAAEGQSFRAVAAEWGVHFHLARGREGESYEGRAEREAAAPALEDELPWHSALFFEAPGPEWRVLYRAEGRPVAVERAFGAGSLVLVSDSYLLSNEALHSPARAPRFLAWLAGAARQIVFDEEHHGLRDEQGVAQLMRKYRLHGLLAALGVLAALFLWKEAVPFLPAAAAGAEPERTAAGRGAAEGLRTLLRRSVPPGRLIEICLAEWRGSASETQRARAEQVWAALPERERRPVAAWRALTEALRTGRGRDGSA